MEFDAEMGKIWSGGFSAKRQHAAHDRVIKAAKALVSEPESCADFLVGLLDHSSESVRSWAALHLLPLDEKSSLAAYKKMLADDSFESKLEIETTVAEWIKGELHPYWFNYSEKDRPRVRVAERLRRRVAWKFA
jgi:HEAT repeat protein